MLAKAPIPTIAELRAEMAQKQAELTKKRAARLQRAWATSAQISAEHSCRRVVLEQGLAEAIARVATSAALCEKRIESQVVGAVR